MFDKERNMEPATRGSKTKSGAKFGRGDADDAGDAARAQQLFEPDLL